VLAGLRTAFARCRAAACGRCGNRGPDDTSGIAAAVALCERAQAVLLCLGEAASMSGEAASRADPALPGRQRALAEAVFETRARVEAARDRRLILRQAADRVVAGRASRRAAGCLVPRQRNPATRSPMCSPGAPHPAGRTPISWPRTVGQVPVFFGQRPSGRPFNAADHYTSKYLDTPNDPLYPFGFGLNYGRFQFTDLRVTPPIVGISEHHRGRRACDQPGPARGRGNRVSLYARQNSPASRGRCWN